MTSITPRVLLAALLLATGCASESGAKRGGGSSDARVQELEARNAELREELRRKEAEIEQSFAATTQAEAAAGLRSLDCAGVTPASSPARGMPRSGAVHSKLKLNHRALQLAPSFSGARTTGGWKVSPGNCQVSSQ
ncbi:hypothetical protein HPC49_36705 [Pyxidicoccus fallax]|uniref:Lipoprotein n=1 Tax=Pyxidicoccus fallax TaxID=394095 RepID=A0A848LTR9_9BACT|nr:hypothetical protein [Pyxidicoccus fallax]NMO20883.1 hypothetical protein [Pyxidicoccus fallax]NPC83747.1 hypothetical protein [Pyxidicoccus fallax]